MSDDIEQPSDPVTDTAIARAAAALGRHTSQRWVEVSDRVLQAALRAPRRARPVQGSTTGGSLQVSEHVVIAYLRSAVDGAVPGTAVHRISVVLTGRDQLDSVVIQLVVQYGTSILDAADQVRTISYAVLDDVLGPAADNVALRVTHVHVDDVTTTDPHLGDPRP